MYYPSRELKNDPKGNSEIGRAATATEYPEGTGVRGGGR